MALYHKFTHNGESPCIPLLPVPLTNTSLPSFRTKGFTQDICHNPYWMVWGHQWMIGSILVLVHYIPLPSGSERTSDCHWSSALPSSASHQTMPLYRLSFTFDARHLVHYPAFTSCILPWGPLFLTGCLLFCLCRSLLLPDFTNPKVREWYSSLFAFCLSGLFLSLLFFLVTWKDEVEKEVAK